MGKANDQAAVMELNEGVVQGALAFPPPQTKTETYAVTVSIFERFGRAFISWQLNPNWSIGNQDCVQLREGNQFIQNWTVTAPSGEVDTGRGFGSGLNASYWSWSYGANAGWRQLVVTPNV